MTEQTVAIHQPNLLPRLKVLQKIAQADAWVVLDDVQFVRREWQNRARLRYARHPDREFWLTLPVHRPRWAIDVISQVGVVDHERTFEAVRRGIAYTYRASPHWDEVQAILDQIPCTPDLSPPLRSRAQLPCSLRLGSSYPFSEHPTSECPDAGVAKLVGICNAIGATEYLSGSGGAVRYTDVATFAASGIGVRLQEWTPPATQPQLAWRDISGLDLLARHGSQTLASHLRD